MVQGSMYDLETLYVLSESKAFKDWDFRIYLECVFKRKSESIMKM